MDRGIKVEEGQKASPSYDDIQAEIYEKGFIVLEKGTKCGLELGYTSSGGEYMQGESLVAHERREVKYYPHLELRKDTKVGDIVGYRHSQNGGENLYKFTLTNEEILELEGESREFEIDLISSSDIPEECFEAEYPEGLEDIDMSLFRYYDPDGADMLEGELEEDPHWKRVVLERSRLNREFVKQHLGDDAITDGLESVRIVVRM